MRHPVHKACVVLPHHGGGVFSLFNKVITCMELYSRVRVDYSAAGTLYKQAAEKNLWDTICHPLPDPPLSAEACDVVRRYPHFRYTGRSAGRLYGRDQSWRARLHRLFQRIKVRREVIELSRSIFPQQLHRSITILHRSETTLAIEQLNGMLPSIDEMCRAAGAVSTQRPIFVCADSHEGTEEFRRRLGPRMMVWDAVDRAAAAGEAPHFKETFGSDHVRRMFALVMAISRTAHLVHPTSNIATAALYMNPRLAHTFVQAAPSSAAARQGHQIATTETPPLLAP